MPTALWTAYLMSAWVVLRYAHPRLKLARLSLRLEQRWLRSKDRNGKCYENILMLNFLLHALKIEIYNQLFNSTQ
jgi:hypothetical protein